MATVQHLLDAQTNPNARHPATGWTALHYASKRGDDAMIKLLLQYNAQPLVETTVSGLTPLDIAASRDNTEAVSLMFQGLSVPSPTAAASVFQAQSHDNCALTPQS
mmetsp:Transcript_27454/g.80129  ORF Transcript_27454/g.80129 Transcript_27454/m.80129 type:complete len:106 (+) Transcript_27454:33-350(+)